MFPIQAIGELVVEGKSRPILLSTDVDVPHEASILIDSDDGRTHTLVVSVTTHPDFSYELKGLYALRNNDAGKMVLLTPSELETEDIQSLTATLNTTGRAFEGTWTNSKKNTAGTIRFQTIVPDRTIKAEPYDTWQEFKLWASRIRASDYTLFRGHGSTRFRLETTFHRQKRARLDRYEYGILSTFRDHAEAALDRRFEDDTPHDIAALLALAQHHSFPTPLLDWTYSPYVAAFFAFTDALENQASRGGSSEHVRIYALNKLFLKNRTHQIDTTKKHPFSKYYLSTLSVSPRGNPRLYAQQGVFLVSHLVDIEDFILYQQQHDSQTYLIGVDIPISQAYEALSDLHYMGISAATLFPGLDGVSKMMKHSMMVNTHNANTARIK